MDRTHRDSRRLLDATDLPESLRERILEVIGRASLRATERVDVTRELIAHFEDGLAAGHDPDELLESFGDGSHAARLIERGKRASRPDADSGLPLPAIARDLRYACRRLLQSPGFALVAILSLALGIGANTAIFSVVNTLLLSDPAVEAPAELVNVYESDADFPFSTLSYPDYRDLRENTDEIFTGIAVSKLSVASFDRGREIESVMLELVTGNYFELLGIEPALGRTLGDEDHVAPGAHPVVMFSHGYWQRAFGGDPGVIGTEVRLTGQPYTIVGVVDPEYKGGLTGLQPDMYAPVMMLDQLEGLEAGGLDVRRNYSYFGQARLREGVTVEQAREAASVVATELMATYPDAWTPDREFLLVPRSDVVIFPAFDGALTLASWLLLGVVGLVLMIACANLASFLLARAVDRRKEIAIRLSLGAGRGQLIRQLLTETVLLSLLGGVAGLVLASWMLSALERVDLPLPVPMTFDFAIDGTVLAFAMGLSLLAGVLFGLAPALQATRADLISTLRDEAAGGGGGAKSMLRSALVVGQVATSVVLLVSAGLFVRSLGAVMDVDPGIGGEPTGIVQLSLPYNAFPEDADVRTTYEDLIDTLRARPDVIEAGLTTNLALDQFNNRSIRFTVAGVDPPTGQDFHTADRAEVSDRFFEAAGIRILQGRTFDEGDQPEGRWVAIVSRATAERFWPGQSAVGQTFRSESDRELTVVGVASDTKMRTIGEAPRPVIYLSVRQSPARFGYLLTSTRGSVEAVLASTLETVRERAPSATMFFAKTMEQHLSGARFAARMTAWLFGVFAILALGLAAIGLYGTVSYAQSQRVREVGIRMSLGADSGSVVRLLLRGGLRLVAIGGALGLVVALAASRILSGLLYGVRAWDPVTFAGVTLVLGSVAVAAAWIPARRATRINPVEALRSE